MAQYWVIYKRGGAPSSTDRGTVRHLWSFLLGLALAPVMWGLTAWSTYRFFQVAADTDPIKNAGSALIVPTLLLVAAGLIIGAVISYPTSPTGTGIAGLAFLVIAALYVTTPSAMNHLAHHLPGDREDMLSAPAGFGTAILLGTAMLAPLASRSRWRGTQPQPAIETNLASLQRMDEAGVLAELIDDGKPLHTLPVPSPALTQRLAPDHDGRAPRVSPRDADERREQRPRAASKTGSRDGRHSAQFSFIDAPSEDAVPMWTPRRLREIPRLRSTEQAGRRLSSESARHGEATAPDHLSHEAYEARGQAGSGAPRRQRERHDYPGDESRH